VSKIADNGSSQGAWTLRSDSHQEFRELCALSTTGELTAEESARLTEHLAQCAACREAQRQYESVVGTLIPALAAESGAEEDDETAAGAWLIEAAEVTLMESLRGEPAPSGDHAISPSRPSPWKQALRYAIAALILATCTLAGYRIGILRGRGPEAAVPPVGSIAPKIPPRPNPSGVAAAPAHEAKTVPDDDQTVALRSQARLDQQELAKLKDQLDQVEGELADRRAELDRNVQDRAELDRQLALAKANAQNLQAKLNQIGDQTAQGTAQSLALKSQVNDLTAALEGKDKQIAQEQELLEHDRDIRNLIGARNLYIAEIYDVAKSGDTQKPFGRVFYTKDKSLVFYGYDLDQQPGLKQASAFQAWGRSGTDRQRDISLGLLYQDDANQKRWVLKFNDAKTIAQIDAVFVTVEPKGGSAKPSGKPLLFAYLRLDPNHP